MPWRDLHDPAPEPEKPGAPKGASVAEAEFPPGFESFAGKDAAAAVNDIATALGFQLPAEGARSEIGAQLLATRNADGKWDGAATLKHVTMELGGKAPAVVGKSLYRGGLFSSPEDRMYSAVGKLLC